MDDPYKVLGVKRSASDEELKQAFRELAKRWHPDRNPGDPDAELRFKEVGEAYRILSDPAQRSLVDSKGKPRFRIPDLQPDFEPENYGLGDFVGDLFSPRADNTFPDLESPPVRVRVPAGVLHSGGVINVPVAGQQLKVRIPSGSRQGSRLKLRGSGPGGSDLVLILES